MVRESSTFNTAPGAPQETLESLKDKFKKRLDAIFYKQLTIENIEHFADDTLNEAAALESDILKEYRNNPNVKGSPTTQDNQAQEKEAFAILDLKKNINEILDQIANVKVKIDSLKAYIDKNVENVETVITSPLQDQIAKIEKITWSFEKKKMLPRLLTLLYIIEHDFDIYPSGKNVTIKEGTVTRDMARRSPYLRVEIPELHRAAYICEEEDNASYVFDTLKLEKNELTLNEIDSETKGIKNSLIMEHPGLGIRIIQTPAWRSQVALALGQSIEEGQNGIPRANKREENGRISEFESRMPYNDFQTEVRTLYPKEGNIQEWYNAEQRKHSNWPSHPYEIYKGKGWTDWSVLVGKENTWKRKYLPFEDFQKEVQASYDGSGDVTRWYVKEQRKHSGDWPSHPGVNYKGKGWGGFRELLGKKNARKK
jgi:hypothetical protein